MTLTNLPITVRDAVVHQLLGNRAIAYLESDDCGALVSLGGATKTFGLDSLSPGDTIDDHVDCLAGVIDPDALPLDLPYMQTPAGVTADISLFASNGRIWIVFLDTAQQEAAQQSVQQKVNTYSLRHDRQMKILDQYLGKEVAERLEEGLAAVEASGERRELAVMFADIRGFTKFSESSQPEAVFETLNVYLGAMIPAVLDERGVLDKIIGDEIMVIFGMIPADIPAPQLAVRAGKRILDEISRLNYQRDRKGLPVLFVGVGVATGPVSLGILGSEARKSVTVIGNHVNLAARLQGQAKANQMVVDANTHRALGDQGKPFKEKNVDLKGYTAPVTAYLYELPLR